MEALRFLGKSGCGATQSALLSRTTSSMSSSQWDLLLGAVSWHDPCLEAQSKVTHSGVVANHGFLFTRSRVVQYVHIPVWWYWYSDWLPPYGGLWRPYFQGKEDHTCWCLLECMSIFCIWTPVKCVDLLPVWLVLTHSWPFCSGTRQSFDILVMLRE